MRAIVWATLGVALLLVGLPLSLAFRLGWVLLALGTLCFVLAGVQWLWDRHRGRRADPEDEDD